MFYHSTDVACLQPFDVAVGDLTCEMRVFAEGLFDTTVAEFASKIPTLEVSAFVSTVTELH